MEITTRLVLRHFMSVLQHELSNKDEVIISPFFSNFFLKNELIDMIEFMSVGDAVDVNDLETMNNNELLEVIGNDHVILDYFLAKWDRDINAQQELSPQNVWNTLEQLGHQTHYLATKVS